MYLQITSIPMCVKHPFFFLVFPDRVSLCNSLCCPGPTLWTRLADLELTQIHLPLPPKCACTTKWTMWSILLWMNVHGFYRLSSVAWHVFISMLKSAFHLDLCFSSSPCLKLQLFATVSVKHITLRNFLPERTFLSLIPACFALSSSLKSWDKKATPGVGDLAQW